MSLTRIGPYRIVRLLGEGGMGRVYEAIHEAIERRVAIKVLHAEFARKPEMLRRFMNEARAVNRINHPALVQISDHGQLPDKTAYIVMEFLDGLTLTAKLKGAGGQLPILKMLQVGQQVSTALAAAHAKQIVHRDLKPDNIMLVQDDLAPGGERVKILDFGIAKLTDSTPQGNGRTATGTIMGTPRYMSPEQCRGLHVTEKADVYSLGILLYQVLSGRTPFDAPEQLALLLQHIQDPPPSLCSLAPQTPLPLAELIECLLRKDPVERPTMAKISDALAKLEAGFVPSARPPAHRLLDSHTPEKVVVDLPPEHPKTEVLRRRSTLGISVGETQRAIRVRRWLSIGSGLAAILSVVWGLKYVLNIKSPATHTNRLSALLWDNMSQIDEPLNRQAEKRSVYPSASAIGNKQTQILATNPAQQESPSTQSPNDRRLSQPMAVTVERKLSGSTDSAKQPQRSVLANQGAQTSSIPPTSLRNPPQKASQRLTSGVLDHSSSLALTEHVPCLDASRVRQYMDKGEYYVKIDRDADAISFFEMALSYCSHPKMAKAIELVLGKNQKTIGFYKYYQSRYAPKGLLRDFIEQRLSSLR